MLYAGIATAAFIAATILFTIKRDYLLPIALTVFALFPIAYVNSPAPLLLVSPPMIIVSIWAIRRRPNADWPPKSAILVCAILLFWLLVKVVTATSFERAVAWTIAFVVLVIVPLILSPLSQTEHTLVKNVWIWLGLAISSAGVVEWLLKTNLLYGSLYESSEYPLLQYWSSYRITTSLGHPLSNSLFLSTACVLAAGDYVQRGRKFSALSAIMCLIGVFLTVSRGGLIAVAVGILLILIARLAGDRGWTSPKRFGGIGIASEVRKVARRKAAGFVGVAIGLLVISQTDVFQDRLASSNGASSALARSTLVPVVWNLSSTLNHLGAGAGNSNHIALLSGQDIIIENSALQLLLSLGVPGLVMIGALTAWVLLKGLTSGDGPAAAALGALAVAALGFNWIESNRPGMLLIGILFALAWRSPEGDTSPPRTSLARVAAESRYERANVDKLRRIDQ